MENLALILANATFQHSDDCPMLRGFRYSGRAMFGGECPGFNLESLTDMLTFGGIVNSIAAEEGTDLGEDMARKARTDNLGLGFVLYFPSVSWGDYDRELCALDSEVAGVDPNEDFVDGEEVNCEHVWNDDNYCKKCGADGNS